MSTGVTGELATEHAEKLPPDISADNEELSPVAHSSEVDADVRMLVTQDEFKLPPKVKTSRSKEHKRDVYKVLDAVPFTPSQGVKTPSPNNMAALRWQVYSPFAAGSYAAESPRTVLHQYGATDSSSNSDTSTAPPTSPMHQCGHPAHGGTVICYPVQVSPPVMYYSPVDAGTSTASPGQPGLSTSPCHTPPGAGGHHVLAPYPQPPMAVQPVVYAPASMYPAAPHPPGHYVAYVPQPDPYPAPYSTYTYSAPTYTMAVPSHAMGPHLQGVPMYGPACPPQAESSGYAAVPSSRLSHPLPPAPRVFRSSYDGGKSCSSFGSSDQACNHAARCPAVPFSAARSLWPAGGGRSHGSCEQLKKPRSGPSSRRPSSSCDSSSSNALDSSEASRLNARQRRTLRRAKERAIAALMETSQKLLQDASMQRSTSAEILLPQTCVSPCDGPTTPPTCVPGLVVTSAPTSTATSVIEGPTVPPIASLSDLGAEHSIGSDDDDDDEDQQRASIDGDSADCASATSKAPSGVDLDGVELSDLIQQLSIKQGVDEKLLRDLQIIQSLIGALKNPVEEAIVEGPKNGKLAEQPHIRANTSHSVMRPPNPSTYDLQGGQARQQRYMQRVSI